MVNWQSDRTLAAPETTVDTWACDLLCVPSPQCFYRATFTPDVGSASTSEGVNTQLGTTFSTAAAALNTAYERWRIAYYSVTVYYDAPALSDQGSCVAAQFPLEANLAGGPGLAAASAGAFCKYKVARFQDRDFPAFETLLTMPNAYSGLAKDGCYLPLRLDSNHSRWMSDADTFVDGSLASPQPDTGLWCAVSATTGSLLFPSAEGLRVEADGVPQADPIIGLASGISGQISFRNLAKVGRLRVVHRVGFECQVSPGTSMTPFLAVSPPYDPMAIAAYFQVSRELKDAYPADYNDLGKLWDVIKKVASVVAPIVPAPLRMIGSVAGNVIDRAFESAKSRRDEKSLKQISSGPRDGPPAAAMERVQKANAASFAKARAPVRSAPKRR